MSSASAPKIYRDELIEQMVNDPNYIIQRDGTILSKKNPRAPLVVVGGKVPSKKSKTVSYGFGNCNLSVPRVVYRKFNGPLDPKKYVVFKNGDREDLRPENLEQITMAEHLARVRKLEKKIDTQMRQLAQMRMAKICTPEIAEIIRCLYAAGVPQVELATLTGFSKPMIHGIVKGKIWKDFSKPEKLSEE